MKDDYKHPEHGYIIVTQFGEQVCADVACPTCKGDYAKLYNDIPGDCDECATHKYRQRKAREALLPNEQEQIAAIYLGYK